MRVLPFRVTKQPRKKMSLATNIVQRPGSAMYYARLQIPPDLRKFYPTPGKTKHRVQLWKSLGTRDREEARELALPVLMQWRRQFAELRGLREPTPADVQDAVWSQYQGALEQDQASRARYPTSADIEAAKKRARAEAKTTTDWELGHPVAELGTTVKSNEYSPPFDWLDVLVMKDAVELDRERRSILLAEYRQHLAVGETALISMYADAVINRKGLLIDRGSIAYRDLCHRLQRAQIQALERTIERDGGNWGGAPTDSIVVPPDLTMGNKFALPGETIMELYDRFKDEKIGTARADTWAQNRKIVKLFAEYLGETAHVTAITRKAVRGWKQELAKWPLKAADTAAFKGMSFRKVIEANAKVGKPAINQKTINKYLSAVGSFAKWLLHNEYVENDVMSAMYLTLDKRQKKRFPFTADQLKTIFNSPLFKTCLGDDDESKPGNVAIRDWRYWVPWIALYSGARLGEITQLLTKDVRQLHGTWIFHITEEGSAFKSTKTAGSMRVVPIHSELIKLGLLDYHAGMIAAGETQLFPQLKPDARGFISGGSSAFFNDYFRAIGVKVDKRVNFHSFRHGIADAFRSAGYLDEQFNVLLGHTRATTTGTYGILPQGILSQRAEMIEAIKFGGAYPLG
jgi:integrase